ncbi:MAG: class I SAM-dependent methyltransferase [Spartobacteria bacterium]|nr:class I SAM-dependent methyltransferase [Spartobacteria bacterium]
MKEASKTRALWSEFEKSLITGTGIDIGCGPDPVTPEVDCFDVDDGDANYITQHVDKTYDFVFSCHCLEHMHDPQLALNEWWKLVNPGGHLIVVVPDEDLYEQGYFPGIFNTDHKNTFTISKQKSWSPRSHNILDIVNGLENSELLQVKLQDEGYNRTYLNFAKYPRLLARTGLFSQLLIRFVFKRLKSKWRLYWLLNLFQLPIDQTVDDAVAQIQFIVRKKS